MKGEDQGQVHQFFRLCVQRAGVMSLVEVIGVALAGVEVAVSELRHFSPHQTEALQYRSRASPRRRQAQFGHDSLKPATDLADSKKRRLGAGRLPSRGGSQNVASTDWQASSPDRHHMDRSCRPWRGSRGRLTINWKRRSSVTVLHSVTEVDYGQVGPAVGELFPDFELPDADGRPVRLHQWRNGRRALVVFYRSAAW